MMTAMMMTRIGLTEMKRMMLRFCVFCSPSWAPFWQQVAFRGVLFSRGCALSIDTFGARRGWWRRGLAWWWRRIGCFDVWLPPWLATSTRYKVCERQRKTTQKKHLNCNGCDGSWFDTWILPPFPCYLPFYCIHRIQEYTSTHLTHNRMSVFNTKKRPSVPSQVGKCASGWACIPTAFSGSGTAFSGSGTGNFTSVS